MAWGELGGELLDIVLFEVLADELQFGFSFVFDLLCLLVHQQRVSVFKRVFGSAFEVAGYFRPPFQSFVVLYEFQQLYIFVKLPRPFFQVRA